MSKVCLDAGHGGSDPGAVNGARQEKNDVLRLALAVGDILAGTDLEVVYTRTDDRYDSPATKAEIANAANVDLMVSFHRNAAVATAKGVECLVYSNTDKKAELADFLCRRYAELGFTNRGVKERQNLAVLRRTGMPSVLPEVGFISNAEDNRIFDESFDQIAKVTAEGILSFFGMSLPQPQAAAWVKENDRWWYRHSDGGYTRNDWELINKRWYYFDQDGWMKTGLTSINNELYYLNEEKNSNEGACMITDVRGVLHVWDVV